MARLFVHVEGETEEQFVNEVLRDHLQCRGYSSVRARLIGNARQRANRGGIRPWPATRAEIVRHLREDSGCISTTMVDYYGLPQTGQSAWPGRQAARSSVSATEKGQRIATAISNDVALAMGANFDSARFVPFVVIHEFEALLFSDCEAFARGISRPGIEHEFHRILDQFTNPEEINDSADTAPSKRIIRLVPEYEKILLGTLAVLEIGLDRIRGACPHFDSWLGRLEQLSTYPN